MGVGLYLTGVYAPDTEGSAHDWLESVSTWIEQHEEEPLMLCRQGATQDERPALYVQIHPSAEDVELTISRPGQLTVSAKTSGLGPGYHIFLCHLLQRLARQFQIAWAEPEPGEDSGDETGFFFGGTADEVSAEMLRWLSALARVVADASQEGDAQVRMVSMPMGYSYPDADGIVTPLGPRFLDWFKAVAATPALGEDFFPWWEEGVSAGFFLGRALTRMWQELRWRVPITEAEAELLMDVHLDLERAYRRAPQAKIPWREWHEMAGYLGDYFGYVEFAEGEDLEEEIRRRAEAETSAAPAIGYRRGRVQVSLTGGWSLVIPGEFAEEWEENGQTWSAWYGQRTVWFSSWSVHSDGDSPRPADQILADLDLPEGEIHELHEGNVVGRASFLPHREDGQSMWNLRAYSAVAGGFALCNIYIPAKTDLPWALALWKTLRH